MDKLFDTIREISRLPVTRQLGLLIGLTLSIVVGASIVMWAQTPDHAVLFGHLDNQDTARVTEALERLQQSYRIDPSTGLVTVPADKVREIRLKLAGEGIPGASSRGFSVLYDEQELGTSSFIEKARYQRALEEELAASIETIESVRAARVHLAIPKKTAFVRHRDKANASVLINLFPGRTLSEEQMAGIVYLVAASVPGLEHENVTLVDQRGRLLSKRTSSRDLMVSAEQHRFTNEVEAKYVASILDILTPILGSDGVRAQVVADLDFVSIEKTSEVYDPEGLALRSEQTVQEQGGATAAIGAPGISDGDASEEANAVPASSTVRATRNYEVDRTISHIREKPGAIKRLSVALVVDYRKQLRADGSVERIQLSEQEIQQIVSLVKETVGFSESRGDTINVVNAPFLETVVAEEVEETPVWKQGWVQGLARQLVGFLGIAFLIFGVLRPLLNRLTAAGAGAGGAASPVLVSVDGGGAGGLEVGNEQITLSGQGAGGVMQLPSYDQQLAGARNLVREDPGKVAQVIKGWVEADG